MDKVNRVEADINLDNIRDNVKMMKACVREDMKLLAVIKADGYGHGAVTLARALDDLADFYAVACIDEGVELRKAGIEKPILILGYTDPTSYEDLIKNDIRTAFYDVDRAKKLSLVAQKLNMTAKIHIKIDTGMGRIGFPCDGGGMK